jgi:hypothetical protein
MFLSFPFFFFQIPTLYDRRFRLASGDSQDSQKEGGDGFEKNIMPKKKKKEPFTDPEDDDDKERRKKTKEKNTIRPLPSPMLQLSLTEKKYIRQHYIHI